MEYLSSHHYVHRDLAARNCLVRLTFFAIILFCCSCNSFVARSVRTWWWRSQTLVCLGTSMLLTTTGCRPSHWSRLDGCLQRASSLASFLESRMSGAMAFCSGRSTAMACSPSMDTQTRHVAVMPWGLNLNEIVIYDISGGFQDNIIILSGGSRDGSFKAVATLSRGLS